MYIDCTAFSVFYYLVRVLTFMLPLLIAALIVMCFLGVLTSMRLIFRVNFFPSVCLLGYMYGLLCQSTLFDCHGLLLLVVLGLFGHCAAGFDSCDPDTWNFS